MSDLDISDSSWLLEFLYKAKKNIANIIFLIPDIYGALPTESKK